MKKFDWEKLIFIVLCIFIGVALLGSLLPLFGYSGKAMVILSKLPEPILMLNWIGFICAIIGLLGYFYYSNLLKKDGYSNEEGSFYEKKENRIQIVKTFSSFCIIINFMLLGLTQANELPEFYDWGYWLSITLGFAGALANNCLIAKVRPELDENITGIGFKKTYFEQLDEREKEKAGRVAFKTMNRMGLIYYFALLFCLVLIGRFDVSPIISVTVGILWFFQTITMLYYSCKEK